ncbi:hypothetical protein E0H73_36360 [Kribbella pittospori]|uniref:DUF3558 domain-containing protein n=1 Tax=Kribbella pittospori TaxID=722689 RepID=A0A4R0KAU6_9ACTN|nr:hypothetical protein [Kribbella pittospori]TCC55078.1 hypothetical protein E0H73_36360 [Kribbella pittospori]
MRRAITILACALTALSLPACKSSDAQQQVANPIERSGNLCERVQPTLAGSWKAEDSEPWSRAPLSDNCWLIDTARSSHRIRVALSVLPVTAAEYVDFRKAEAQELRGSAYVTAPVDGGVGPESWAVIPAAAAPWIVVRSNDRLVRLKENSDGQGGIDELRTVAKAITTLAGGLPAAKAVIERPECTRGTAAAEKALAGKAIVRRDNLVAGFAYCQWGSNNHVVYSRAGRVGSDPALNFRYMHDAGTAASVGVHPVSVGTEGWQQSDGYLAYRIGQQTFVSVAAVPDISPAKLLPLAQAMAPTYGG